MDLHLSYDSERVVIEIPPGSRVVANGRTQMYGTAGQFTIELHVTPATIERRIKEESDRQLLAELTRRLEAKRNA